MQLLRATRRLAATTAFSRPFAALRCASAEAPKDVYGAFKKDVPDHLLLVQLGKFFELRDEEATRAAKVLPLLVGGNGLAGFPIGRVDVWLPRFYEAFDSVALVEQVGRAEQSRPAVRTEMRRGNLR